MILQTNYVSLLSLLTHTSSIIVAFIVMVKKIILFVILGLLLAAGIKDAIHFFQPDAKNKTIVEAAKTFPAKDATEIMMVYNAYNGIFPAAIDFVKKNVFPSSYPCNLCLLAFGNSGPKPVWHTFLESIPYKKTELHKENFRRQYLPENTQLPAILLKKNNEVEMLVTAETINKCSSLPQLIDTVRAALPQ